ncbi:MAG TPA: hypothetical protein VIV11_18960 [Kofleriaceae bacterium]
MNDDDVRNLGGRFVRLVVSAIAGVVLAPHVMALVLSRREVSFAVLIHPVVAAGACSIAMGLYAMLGVLERRLRGKPTWLPRATLRRSRR